MDEDGSVRDDGVSPPSGPELAKLMAILSNETRVEVLANLALRRHAVGELARRLDLDDDAISHALQVLRRAGLVRSRSVGQRRIYRLTGSVKASTTASAVLLEIKWQGRRVRLELARPPE